MTLFSNKRVRLIRQALKEVPETVEMDTATKIRNLEEERKHLKSRQDKTHPEYYQDRMNEIESGLKSLGGSKKED
jgi:hypothetical protein